MMTVHGSHPDVVKRLKRANGHLLKTIEMIEGGRSCVDVAQQLHAVEKAVGKAKKVFIHDHVDHCLERSVDDAGARGDVIAEFKTISKYL
jgi:DNA-binding FrmR family transcriptional regulator